MAIPTAMPELPLIRRFGILDGNTSSYAVLDGVEVTGLALDYEAGDFEPSSQMTVFFSDDMESGSDNWTWS